jgi:hypothetical protein
MENLEISKLFSVKGLVAVITGGGSGKFGNSVYPQDYMPA